MVAGWNADQALAIGLLIIDVEVVDKFGNIAFSLFCEIRMFRTEQFLVMLLSAL